MLWNRSVLLFFFSWQLRAESLQVVAFDPTTQWGEPCASQSRLSAGTLLNLSSLMLISVHGYSPQKFSAREHVCVYVCVVIGVFQGGGGVRSVARLERERERERILIFKKTRPGQAAMYGNQNCPAFPNV